MAPAAWLLRGRSRRSTIPQILLQSQYRAPELAQFRCYFLVSYRPCAQNRTTTIWRKRRQPPCPSPRPGLWSELSQEIGGLLPYRSGRDPRHYRHMTEPPASRTEPESGTSRVVEPPGRGYHDDRYDRPNRLNQVLVWVGIVAGVVFIVALVFFSGFWIGRATGHHYGWHGYSQGQMAPGQMTPGQSSGMNCPAMMGPGGMMGPSTTTSMTPGQMGPGPMGPGGMGPGGMTTTPTTARP